MKVSALSVLYGVNDKQRAANLAAYMNAASTIQDYKRINDLSGMPYIYPITFTSIQNSSKLRQLFAYDLPCMYSGITMIDPKQLSRMLKNQTFLHPSGEVISVLSKYKDSFTGMELQLYNILAERSKIHPDKNISELMREIEPIFRKDLYKKQAPIFYDLKKEFSKLSPELQEQFNSLMIETDKRLSKQPVIMPFSAYEFKYKLAKIKEEVLKIDHPKAKKVMNKLIKESKRLSNSTNPSSVELQKKVLRMMDWIVKKSVLKDYQPLRELIDTSNARLTNTEVVIPFSRKSFLYDLARLINPIEDKALQDKIMKIAQKLPTSSQDFSAYFLKLSCEPPEKIGSRIMWPSLASVEHIVPRSCGGPDEMANFGGARTVENSDRKSIDFMEQLKRRPDTPKYCQMYVDRLIDLYHQGIFAKHRINPKYIEDFKNTIYKVSKETIELDISRM